MVGIVSVRSGLIIFTASWIALPFASATLKEGALYTFHGVPDGGIPWFGGLPTDAEVFMGPLLPVAHSTKDVSFTSCPARKELGRKPFFTASAGPTAIAPTPRSFSTPLGISVGRPPGRRLQWRCCVRVDPLAYPSLDRNRPAPLWERHRRRRSPGGTGLRFRWQSLRNHAVRWRQQWLREWRHRVSPESRFCRMDRDRSIQLSAFIPRGRRRLAGWHSRDR